MQAAVQDPHVRVVYVDLHAEGDRQIGNSLANSTIADQAHARPGKLARHDHRLPVLPGLIEPVTNVHAAGKADHEAERHLRHRLRITRA